MKAQISFEYIIIAGLVLVMVIPLFFYSLRETETALSSNKAGDAVEVLGRTVDTVYSIGPGTRHYVTVDLPKGVTSVSVQNKSVTLKVKQYGGIADVFADTKAPLVGSFPINPGRHTILVEMLDSGYVRIGSANDTIAPQVTWTDPSGLVCNRYITLKALTNEPSGCRFSSIDQGYGSMPTPFAGSSLTHDYILGFQDEGDYAYYIRCMDPFDNVMQSSAVMSYVINLSLCGLSGNATNESIPPNIRLLFPGNGYADTSGSVVFSYNVTDHSPISHCRLIFNSSIMQTSYSVERDIAQNFTQPVDKGSYLWSVNCTDVWGNQNRSLSRLFSTNFSQDLDIPVVRSIAPANNSIRNYWLVSFIYNVTDASSGISSCSVNMRGLLDANSTLSWSIASAPIVENASQSIIMPLLKGNYSWNISCVDDSLNGNKGVSENRNLRINISAGEEAFLDSCSGWCGYSGLRDGTCENSENKCADNCGLPYSSSHDCYAGQNVSQTYCNTGGAEADTCCCIA
ncbi:MAG TPA: hypothetical protein VJB08_03225 [Candidatus Nanoarchaeia archaeon]|nr:hypothetical protein [Candidatus Nanoarchaeia archaeon]